MKAPCFNYLKVQSFQLNPLGFEYQPAHPYMAVANEWGGPDSAKKANDAIEEIFAWFTRGKGEPT